jgi:uroporphyrinogen decarboxylase
VESFPWPRATDFDFIIYERAARYLPPGMKIITTTGHLFTTAWQMMGFEAFCVKLIEDLEMVQRIIDIMGERTLDLLEHILAHECVGAVCTSDDIAYTSGPMISPGMLRKIFFPWLKKTAEVVHAYGRPLIYHTDGDLTKVLPDIVEAGVDVFHPVEPKCMDIVAIKHAYGDRLALIGNVDLGYTLTMGTPDEVREEVKYLIKNVAPGGGYLIGSANSITNYVPMKNYQALLEAVRDFGKYPISIA